VYKLIRRVTRIGTVRRQDERGDIVVDKRHPNQGSGNGSSPEGDAYRVTEELYEMIPGTGNAEDESVPFFTLRVRRMGINGKPGPILDLTQERIIEN
jgi:hypothetical protein